MKKMNCIDEKQKKKFLDTYKKLILFANRDIRFSNQLKSLKDWGNYETFTKDIYTVKNYIFNNKNIIEKFIKQSSINKEHTKIIKEWKKSIVRNFILLEYYGSYSIFIDPKTRKTYGVLGLTDDISKIIPRDILPIIVYTTIIPYYKNIIYDGILQTRSLFLNKKYLSYLKYKLYNRKKKASIITRM